MFGRIHQSILARTTLVILGAAGLAGLFFVFIAAQVTASRAEERAKVHLSQLLDTIESSVSAACYVNDKDLAREILIGLLKNNDVSSVKILGGNQVLAEESRMASQAYGKPAVPVHRKISSPFDNTNIIGEIIVTPNPGEIINQSKQSVSFIVMLLSGQLLVIAAIVLPSVLYLVSRPIKKLSDELHNMDPVSGAALPPLKGHEHDEIGRLVFDINTLAGRFRESLGQEKSAREAIESGEKALIESELRYRTIFENSSDAIFLMRDNIFVDCNDSTLQIFACQRSDIVGCTPFRFSPELQPSGGNSSELAMQYIRAAYAGAPQFFEWEHCQFDGTCFSAEVSLKLIKLQHSAFLQAIVRNISARKHAEQMLKLAKAEAEKTSQAKSTFLASMSHELRTPLNAIIGFAQMLDMGVPAPLQLSQKEPVRHILDSGRHLLGLINEVLDLTRIEAGKMDIILTSVALQPLIQNIVSLTEPVAASRRIKLQYTCADTMHVLGDASRVRQVLLNLLSNAVKYNREDGLVVVSCKQKNGLVHISVSDTGAGIHKDKYAQLFQPFQRLGAEQTVTEGSGIGLVICRKLAEAMGGQVGFESKVGVGSRFWLELPVAIAAVPSQVVEEAAALRQSNQLKGLVLYVEDSPVNVSVMRHIFSQLPGVELQAVETAEAGLELIAQRPPDLVLMDINLPGISGLQALQIIKSNPLTAAIPVLAVSAAALPQDVKSGLEAGFVAYLTKPFDVPELIAKVCQFLQQRV